MRMIKLILTVVLSALAFVGMSAKLLTVRSGHQAYDAKGNEVWSRALDMDGNFIEENGNVGMIPFLFQGQYYDRETGLYYNRFRYYSPEMGMYLSSDPIGLAGNNPTLYGYVQDVNTWLDELGLFGDYLYAIILTPINLAVAKLFRKPNAELRQGYKKY